MTLGMFAVVPMGIGMVSAAPADVLQPAGTITYNEELVVNDTGRFDSIYIGKQDEGGVTFFNGTIVNSTTTNTDDAAGAEVENPVTFGDDVRIDGRIWRGETSGSGDDMPTIILDDMEISGDLTIAGDLSGYYTNSEVDALVATGGHDHIGETWSGSVTGGTAPAVLTLTHTGSGYGLIATSGGNYVGIAGAASGTSAAVYGLNTSSGPGVTGISSSGYGVYARSVSGSSLYVDGRLGINAASNKAAGSATIASAQTCVTVNNTLVTGNSYILLTVQESGGVAGDNANSGIRVSGVVSGTNFSVCTMNGQAAQKFGGGNTAIPFRYLIINQISVIEFCYNYRAIKV